MALTIVRLAHAHDAIGMAKATAFDDTLCLIFGMPSLASFFFYLFSSFLIDFPVLVLEFLAAKCAASKHVCIPSNKYDESNINRFD